jgi:hypothetical protein
VNWVDDLIALETYAKYVGTRSARSESGYIESGDGDLRVTTDLKKPS